MKIADMPANEDLRMKDLASYEILDTAAESDFDDLVELAGQICKCPISLITLLDKDRQWFKANRGLNVSGTSRDVAFCSHAIHGNKVFKIENALEDERFFDNPLVTGDPNIRFYAGAPIFSPTGHKLGTICIIDHKPKTISAEEERALVLLSNQVTKLLEIRRKNILIRQRAEEIISLKSRAINRVVQETETDKKAIAANLHESFAQGIASSLLYLQMAEQNKEKRLELLGTAQQQLQNTLTDIRNLSYTITPITVSWLSAEELIAEFISKIANTYSFSTEVKKTTQKISSQPGITLLSIRMLEQWLKLLAERQSITQVKITVAANDQFELLIEDNEANTNLAEREKKVFGSTIYDKVHSYGGWLSLPLTADGKNALKIRLPLKTETALTADSACMESMASDGVII